MTSHLPYFSFLSSRALLRLSGADVQSFLQGIITNNIRHLSAEKPLYAALLSPQGKVLFDFFLYADDDEILIEAEARRIEELQKRLHMYKLRADVKIIPEPALHVAALWGSDTGDLPKDPRHPKAGARVVCESAILTQLCETFRAQKTDENAYCSHALHLGLPNASLDIAPDSLLAAEIGLEALNGVDFAKGCYVGQEVTARSKHRGTVRKGLCMVALEHGEFPEIGTPLLVNDESAGEMRSSIANLGMAVLRFEHVGQAIHTAKGAILRAKMPAWAPQDAA